MSRNAQKGSATDPQKRTSPDLEKRAPSAPPPPPPPPASSPPAAKKEDISRWEGEGGAPAHGSQGRSKDGPGTGKVRPPRPA